MIQFLYISGLVSFALILAEEPGISRWFWIPCALLWPLTMPMLALRFAVKKHD